MQPPTRDPALSHSDTVAAVTDSAATMAADAGLLRTQPREDLEAVPEQIGRFRVLRRLGAGGMGVVFAGFDLELDRKVAIKLLLVDRGEGSIGRTRMMREAQAMARLSHPNVIQIYETGTFRGQIFLAMEYVSGRTLDAWQSARRRPWREILAMYLQAGRGLAAAHAVGIIHRDFKPDNALVDRDGRLRVLDFGLATRGGELNDSAPTTTNPADLTISALDRSLTHVGAVMGTPAYMSPEQAIGAAVDARTDQFSLCVALWEAIYGQRPFAGESLPELSLNLSAGTIVPPPRGSSVPGWLHRALLRGLQVDPERRWPDLNALLTELSQGPGRTSRRLLAAAGIVAVIGVGVGLARPGETPCEGGPARLQGVWDDDTRAAAAAAASASGLPFADDTATRTAAALDAHAAAWLASYQDACLAHHRGEQSDALLDLRMRCLEQRRDELHEASTLLQGADASTVERGPQIAATLASLTPCADIQGLSAAVPPPQDPALVTQVDALRRVLTRSRALESAARYPEATTLAQEVVTAATPLAYPPLLAEATARLGRLSNRTGDFALAATQLEDAYYLALAARHDEIAGDAAVRLVRLYGDRLGDDAQAGRWQRSAAAFVARAGPDSQLAAGLHNSLGTVHMKRDRQEEARAEFEQMVAIFEKDPGVSVDDLANALSNLGATLEALGRLDEAEARLTRSLQLREQTFGPEHPNTAMTLGNLANVYEKRGDWAGARRANERVIAIFTRSLGPRHANTAMVSANLARCLAKLHDPAARERYEQTIATFIEVFGEQSPMLAELRAEYAASGLAPAP
ncbi:MAG: serine/threonine protein kinase [Nannocystis sp.]|uniref:serine/threonine-protein kinase n=1 Tax=Nannocystis sp. TaxID=1962667 RepID=UPI002428F996|nr:serine/threonine-protein kinase [Nannocystis sp.]MBK9757472.1 serine/threonine protein kinase [Nannocystis sp.]